MGTNPCVSNSFRASPSVNFTHTHSVSSALIVRFKMVEQHISIIVTKGSAISGAKRGNGDSNEEDQHEGHEETVHHSHRHGGRRSHGARRLRFIQLVQFIQQFGKRFFRCCWAVRKSALLAGPATVPGVFISMGTAVPMTVFRRYEEEPPMERRASQRSDLWFFQDSDG